MTQYRFDEAGHITLVPSSATERGPDETQADLDTALREQRDLPLWASDDGPRIAPEED
jgi:hypothetical protein